LLYGVQAADSSAAEQPPTPYEREPTEQEEAAFAEDLARQNHVNQQRQYAASAKASRDATRARLQEQKALIKTFTTGDWVLRARKRNNKFEPFYDGPWAVRRVHPGNTYSLASPGGIELESHINGIHLFPAYVEDGHPERSMWYANKRLLEEDRRRQLKEVGIDPGSAKAMVPKRNKK
jgi:hypothetical protein